MCGIFGTIFRDPRRRPDNARVVAARDSLIHRGPDEAGLWAVPGAALAHRRLKVLDLTHGQQPVVDDAGRFAMVYNGEVYNFRELRERYRAAGDAFTTQCDTEVVFAALNRRGTAALDDFNGMFALGHWDNTQRQLLLIRDRLGKKPLYWFGDAEQIVFASELKAVLVYLDRRFDVDPFALDRFFSRGYIPAPHTIFTGIQKLPAGCLLRADAHRDRWAWRVEPYWDFHPRNPRDPRGVPGDPEAALDQLDELLTDAVRMRLVSDVPIGCLLSGGIDSSLITALAAKVSTEPVKAFSIGFEESAQHNELPYAEIVAKRHGCRWFSQMARGNDFMAMLADTAPFIDEPYGNFTVFSMRQLARMAREHLVVVLSGQGGDELSAGYPGRYNWATEAPPTPLSRYAPPVDDLIQHLNHSSFFPWTGGCDAILSPGLREEIQRTTTPADDLLPFWGRHAGLGRLNNVLYTDVRTNLADYLICLEERMTMSVSLEARNPLLDYRVVDFMLSLAGDLKVRAGKNKWVLMELARRYVPAAAIDRPKRGFTPPLDMWLTTNAAAIVAEFRATDAQTADIYSPQWRQFLQRGQYVGGAVMPAFYSLMLSQWVKHYGRYIGAWPGAAGGSRGKGAVASPWQAALRVQSPAAVAEARWFCQALTNLPPGAGVVLHGDVDGWFAFLARRAGYSVIDQSNRSVPAHGHVHIGLEALGALANPAQPSTAQAPGAITLIFAPFATSQTEQVNRVLGTLTSHTPLAGYQAIPLSAERALLVGRCKPIAAVQGSGSRVQG